MRCVDGCAQLCANGFEGTTDSLQLVGRHLRRRGSTGLVEERKHDTEGGADAHQLACEAQCATECLQVCASS